MDDGAIPPRELLDGLLPGLRAFAIPMPVKFRGTTLREGALLPGPAGWGEFSPFPEYGPRECARWLAQEAPVIGLGVETVGTDAGAAHSFDPPFPCHAALLGAGKYGLTQLQNLAALPPAGAVVIAGPLPITGGSGSPARVLALVERP